VEVLRIAAPRLVVVPNHPTGGRLSKVSATAWRGARWQACKDPQRLILHYRTTPPSFVSDAT
jgi:hypothetical protein